MIELCGSFKEEVFIKNLLENTSDLIVITDKEGNIIFSNRDIEKIFPRDVVGQSFDIFRLFTSLEIVKENNFFASSVDTGDCKISIQGNRIEGLWERKEHYYYIIKKVDIINNNKINYTKEKIDLNTFIDIIPDAVFLKDLNERYIACNNSFVSRYLFTNKDYVIGKTDWELGRDSQLIDLFDMQNKQVISAKETKVFEDEYRLPSGELICTETKKSPFYNEKGELIGIIGIVRDITARKDMERSLKDTEEKFLQIASSINDIFWISEMEKILYISPSYEKVIGRSHEELFSNIRKYYDYIHEEDRERIISLEKCRDYSQQCYFDEEYRLVKEDGTIIWLWEKRFIIKDAKGNPIRVSGIIKDITEVKNTHEALIKAKEEIYKGELEKQAMLLNKTLEIEKLRSEFFSNLSHELRTPLNIIIAALQLLETGQLDENKNKEKYFKILKQNSYRLLRLINNLIDSTKIDAGFMNLNAVNCNIVALVEDITMSVVEYARLKDISIIFDTNVEESTLACDQDKIERILLNLLSNAIKFSNKGDSIYVNIKKGKTHTTLSVKDTGIGIPEDKMDMLFLRFRQINSSLVRMNEGSGIGLSLSKSFVEMHGGTIEVKSTYGKGTEFIIKLPNKIINEEHKSIPYISQEDKLIEKIKIEFSEIYV